ncbi:FAD-binding oxidoreductase [Pantoea sp. Ap-967]|uniref:NAD(P)/FAD-dependent oxidoreductase n=1 Tax=Pantoea sp. Ap-967 TaxID=2608362 RepID=UPI00141E67E3|nr:FAD-binding oxidoreductase [Pantoea sp. Ap-967]NIE72956.1 FAD-binding oxidoreductase [Pantoea sp. Ap-967]
MQAQHTASYYAESTTVDEYPRLVDAIECDVCVIGGGFTGVNTSIELAQRGVSVALVEGGRIGWGATGRNGGQLIRGVGHDLTQFKSRIGQEGIDRLEALGVDAVNIVRDRIKEHDIKCDLTWGYCDLANNASHTQAFIARQKHYVDSGYEHASYVVGGDDIHSVVGSNSYVSAFVDMGSGHLHPLKLIAAEARVARAAGVAIFEQSPAEFIEYHRDYVLIRTALGSIKASRIVIACNAHINGLEPTLSARVLPAGSYIIATEPLSPSIQRELLPQNFAASDNQVGLNYFRLSRDGRLLFGGACHYSGRDPKDIGAYMLPKMLNVFPQLAGVKLSHQWGGMIGIGANRFPQVGRLTHRPQVYYGQAYSGHGLNATHLAAKLIAEAITRESADFELFNGIPHMAFPGGRYLRSPLLALGMMWLRIKELTQ